MTMRIRPANQHPILLNDAEPRRGLARARQRTLPAVRAQGARERVAFGCDARAPREQV